MSGNSVHTTRDERYRVNPFDFMTDLFCSFSDQVIHMVLYLDGSIRYGVLQNAVEMASVLEPITRCRIIRDQDFLWWQEIRPFSGKDRVIQLSSRNPKENLYQALSFPLDPYRGMLFQVILIADTGGEGDILVINAHHIAMDARGLKDLARLIMRLYTAGLTGDIEDIPASPVSSRQLPQVSSLIRENLEKKPSDARIGWSSRISVPVQSYSADTYRYSVLTLSAGRTKIIHAARREWGITVNDLMTAIIVRAITFATRMESEKIVPIYATIDMRRYLSKIPERSLINFSTSFEVRVPVKPGESLEDTSKRVHILMNEIKSGNPGIDEATEVGQISASGHQAACDSIAKQWESILQAGNKTTIFSNTGIIGSFRDNRVEPSVIRAFILPGHFQPPGFFFALSTFQDTMTLSASYAVPAYNPVLVRRMFSYIDAIIPGSSRFRGEYEILG